MGAYKYTPPLSGSAERLACDRFARWKRSHPQVGQGRIGSASTIAGIKSILLQIYIKPCRKRLELFQRQRAAKQIALIDMAALAREEVPLCLGFHSLGDHRQPQAIGQRDDHLCNGGIVGVDQDVPDETAVDFQLVQRQSLQVGQR